MRPSSHLFLPSPWVVDSCVMLLGSFPSFLFLGAFRYFQIDSTMKLLCWGASPSKLNKYIVLDDVKGILEGHCNKQFRRSKNPPTLALTLLTRGSPSLPSDFWRFVVFSVLLSRSLSQSNSSHFVLSFVRHSQPDRYLCLEAPTPSVQLAWLEFFQKHCRFECICAAHTRTLLAINMPNFPLTAVA